MNQWKNKYKKKPKPLGIGGQAEVFEAIDQETLQIVAYKRAKPKSKDNIARLRHEIEVLKSIENPHIMNVLDHADDFTWYTMPVAKTVLYNAVPIDDETLVEIVESCAIGLQAAHDMGYIHRDITPTNIMLLSDAVGERWVIADWGLVRLRGRTTVIRTLPHNLHGTEGFAAPEMWDDAHNASQQADVYSLGRVVAYCLTGIYPKPNMPLIPNGIWQKFVERTTEYEVVKRAVDMQAVLHLLKEVKLFIKDLQVELELKNVSLNVMYSLFYNAIEEFLQYVHPIKGVRFSHEATVSNKDIVLLPSQILDAIMTNNKFLWGYSDGTGDPIKKTFSEYFDSISTADFLTNIDILFNEVVSRGNAIDNAGTFYSNSNIIEYHNPGTNPDYGGMDWQSIRLVFEQFEGNWFLVGLINDYWTI